MDAQEAADFLMAERTVVVATNGRDGWPHLMPLWYILRPSPDGELWSWTYASSQKSRNLERDPRATLQVESGETYDQLRGVMITAEAVVHRDAEVVHALGLELFRKYTVARGEPHAAELHPQVEEMIAKQAPKRIGLQFVERGRVTWDHRKLGGVY